MCDYTLIKYVEQMLETQRTYKMLDSSWEATPFHSWAVAAKTKQSLLAKLNIFTT